MSHASHILVVLRRTLVHPCPDPEVIAGPTASTQSSGRRSRVKSMRAGAPRDHTPPPPRGHACTWSATSTATPRHWRARRRRGRPDLPGRPGSLPRLRRPLTRHLPRPVRRGQRRRIVELRTARRFDEARELRPRGCGRGRRPRRGDRGRRTQAVRRDCSPPAHPDLPHLRQRRRAALWPEYAGPDHRARRRDARHRRPGLRLRRRRSEHPDAHPVRDQRRGVRRQGRGARRRSTSCARTSRPRCPS